MPIDRTQLISKEDKTRMEAEAEAANRSVLAMQYLRDTDWYVIRMLETEIPVPQDVADKRAAARADVI